MFALISRYGYFILFPIAVVEGPIITIIGGLLASTHQLNFYIAYAVLVVGDVVGDLLYYAVGYWGREKFIRRWGGFLRISVEDVEAMERKLKHHQVKMLFLGKFLQGAGSGILVAAGAARISVWKFAFYEFLGTVPKTLTLFLIGYYFGSTYEVWNRYLNYITYGTGTIAAIAIVIYLVHRRRRMPKK